MLLLVVSVSVGTIPCVNISFVVSICVYMVVVFFFGERSDTWCVCTVCSVHLCDALTGRECFRRYHTLREY